MVYAGTSTGVRYTGLLLMGIYSCSMPVSLAMISSNVGGFTKRSSVSAIYFIMYCAGNIIGPQLFFEHQAPKYQVSDYSFYSLPSKSRLFVGCSPRVAVFLLLLLFLHLVLMSNRVGFWPLLSVSLFASRPRWPCSFICAGRMRDGIS